MRTCFQGAEADPFRGFLKSICLLAGNSGILQYVQPVSYLGRGHLSITRVVYLLVIEIINAAEFGKIKKDFEMVKSASALTENSFEMRGLSVLGHSPETLSHYSRRESLSSHPFSAGRQSAASLKSARTVIAFFSFFKSTLFGSDLRIASDLLNLSG